MTRGRWVTLALGVALFLLGARAVAAAVVEFRWFAAFGDGGASLWRARAVALAVLRGFAGVVGALYVYANLLGVVSTVDTVVLPRRVGGLDIVESVPAARLRSLCALAGLAIGGLLALPLDDWQNMDALLTRRSLAEIEPYTGRDLSFFVHWLPVENALYAWALFTLVVTGAIVAGLYALTPGLRWAGGRPRLSGRVRRHLTLFGVAILLLLAWGHRLDAYALLSGGSGDGGAFTGVDQLGAMPARFALGALTALASLVVLRAGWVGQPRVAFWVVGAVVAGALLVRGAAGPITARVADARLLTDADAAAAANRALYTQRAFAVDRVRAAPAGYALTPNALSAGAVSAWDAPALARAATVARRTLADGDVGFQPAGAGLAAVLVEYAPPSAARAGATEPTPERTLVVLDAARADEVGRPVALGDRPLSDAGRRVTLLVYPGAAGRAIVGGGAGERGIVGDPLDGWRVRIAHALAGRDLRLAFAASDVPAARAVSRRDVRARVDALAPFFVQGRGVVPVVAGDSIWYAVSLYSASDSYPLSQRYTVGGGDWAAFRHAATALVNAQSGGVRLVPATALDADARAWVGRFRRLFTPAGSLPGELARALPPPTDGALVQAYAYAQFGARGERPPVLRRVQPPDGGDTALAGPGRAPLALPAVADESTATPATAAATAAVPGWTLPLLSSSDRVEGVIVALGGPAPQTLWLPSGPTAPRWQELLDALGTSASPTAGPAAVPVASPTAGPGAGGPTANATVSAPTGGLDLEASTAARADARGRLRVVPAANGLAYARPEYRIGTDGAPALAGVVAFAGDSTRVGGTVAAAIAPPPDASGGAAPAGADGDPLRRARELYAESRAALRRGDWTSVGRALDALGTVLGAPTPARPAP